MLNLKKITRSALTLSLIGGVAFSQVGVFSSNNVICCEAKNFNTTKEMLSDAVGLVKKFDALKKSRPDLDFSNKKEGKCLIALFKLIYVARNTYDNKNNQEKNLFNELSEFCESTPLSYEQLCDVKNAKKEIQNTLKTATKESFLSEASKLYSNYAEEFEDHIKSLGSSKQNKLKKLSDAKDNKDAKKSHDKDDESHGKDGQECAPKTSAESSTLVAVSAVSAVAIASSLIAAIKNKRKKTS